MGLLWLFLLAGILFGVRQLLLYPSPLRGWQHVFHRDFRSERQILSEKFKERRAVKSKERGEVAELKQEIESGVRSAQERLRGLEEEKGVLLRSLGSHGKVVDTLDGFVLREHALEFTTRMFDGGREVDGQGRPVGNGSAETEGAIIGEGDPEPDEWQLEGVGAHVHSDSKCSFVRVRSGSVSREVRYELTGSPDAGYTKNQVERFGEEINKQRDKSIELRGKQRQDKDRITGCIEAVKSGMETAAEVDTRRITDLRDAQREDPRRASVEDGWGAAREDWHKLTGRRPSTWRWEWLQWR